MWTCAYFKDRVILEIQCISRIQWEFNSFFLSLIFFFFLKRTGKLNVLGYVVKKQKTKQNKKPKPKPKPPKPKTTSISIIYSEIKSLLPLCALVRDLSCYNVFELGKEMLTHLLYCYLQSMASSVDSCVSNMRFPAWHGELMFTLFFFWIGQGLGREMITHLSQSSVDSIFSR